VKAAIKIFSKKALKAIINFFAIVPILLLVLVIHEYGHLQEMQKRRVAVKEFSIGIGPLIYQHNGREFDVSLRLVPIMAYVQPSDAGSRHFDSLSVQERTIIDAAGIRNNLVAGTIVVISLQILGYAQGRLSQMQLAVAILSTPIKIVLLYISFVVQCLSLGLIRQSKRLLLSTGKKLPHKSLEQFIGYNLAIGLFNLFPITPLDGGRIAQDIILPLIAHYRVVILIAPYSMLILLFFFWIAITIPIQLFQTETIEK